MRNCRSRLAIARGAADDDVLAAMTDSLAHRGPDDRAMFRSEYAARPGRGDLPGCGLGFRRLSIIDPTSGRQPLTNEDGSVHVVCNGEIYNFVDLRRRLEGRGHVFRTGSDAEAIVHLYEDEGPACIQRLVGMFALAIWDANHGRLVLARDRFGQKPLFYYDGADRLLFGSELKALLAGGAPREPEPAAIDAYLTYQYVPHPQAIYRGIRKLAPAHLAVLEGDELRVQRYWSLPEKRSAVSRREAAEQVRELLTESVRLRLQSDVPLGAFLSGGVDSTLIAGIAQELTGEPLKTFSIGFADPAYDETPHAAATATRLGTQHRQEIVEPNAVEMLPLLVRHYDEPLGDASAVPTWALAALARRDVTVSLSGDGGDEVFRGYERYRGVRLAERIDRAPDVVRRLIATLGRLAPKSVRYRSPLRRWRRFVEALEKPPLRRYFDWIAIFDEAKRTALYSEDFLNSLPERDPFEFLDQADLRSPDRDGVEAVSRIDLATYLPCDLMCKVDIATMAHALECRQPFLDHRLVEFCCSLPTNYHYRRGRGKRLLAEAFPEHLPREVLRRPKRGFGVPLDRWFRGPLRDYARDLLTSSAADRGWFEPSAVARLLEEHAAGQADHSSRLWALVVLEEWARCWLDGAADPGQ